VAASPACPGWTNLRRRGRSKVDADLQENETRREVEGVGLFRRAAPRLGPGWTDFGENIHCRRQGGGTASRDGKESSAVAADMVRGRVVCPGWTDGTATS
jgi:hypothetical protein